eukprot:1160994-Pelagomonas_calceolata.AAC.16
MAMQAHGLTVELGSSSDLAFRTDNIIAKDEALRSCGHHRILANGCLHGIWSLNTQRHSLLCDLPDLPNLYKSSMPILCNMHANLPQPDMAMKSNSEALRKIPLRDSYILRFSSFMYANKLATTWRAIENKNTSRSQVMEPGASNNPPDPHQNLLFVAPWWSQANNHGAPVPSGAAICQKLNKPTLASLFSSGEGGSWLFESMRLLFLD